MSMLIPVILSGGAGTRLWPVSRSSYPKPFMRMGDGRTLAVKTLERARSVAGNAPVVTVTSRDYYFLTRDEYADAGHPGEPFLLEPCARNTAPAVAAAACYVKKRFGSEAKMLVLPADHLVEDLEAFGRAVRHAEAVADQGYLVTFGIPPTQPDTGFGYIRQGAAIEGTQGRRVEAFVEKPDAETAKRYLESGDYTWNSGMFLFRADALLEAMDEVALDILEGADRVVQASDVEASPVELDRASFEVMPDISFDYAVMEKAAKRAVVAGEFDWNDIGSWQAVSDLGQADERGNRVEGPAVLVDSENCYLQSDNRLIAAVGVKDLVVVDTGDAVLVASRDRSQDVRKVVSELKARNHEAATYHKLTRRPWGSYEVLEDQPTFKVKRLVVRPGQVLSLQLHYRRSEHWTVVSGTATVTVGEEERQLHRNESVGIPVETKHRLENATDEDLVLIEVQCGDYLGEDDIVRFEDVYGRT